MFCPRHHNCNEYVHSQRRHRQPRKMHLGVLQAVCHVWHFVHNALGALIYEGSPGQSRCTIPHVSGSSKDRVWQLARSVSIPVNGFCAHLQLSSQRKTASSTTVIHVQCVSGQSYSPRSTNPGETRTWTTTSSRVSCIQDSLMRNGESGRRVGLSRN